MTQITGTFVLNCLLHYCEKFGNKAIGSPQMCALK